MATVTNQLAALLRGAREAKGLTQRALSELARMPQSHISRIESGAVDLRVSSLVELARVLDLELTLVPRQSVTAVNSIVRSTNAARVAEGAGSTTKSTANVLKQLQQQVVEITRLHPTRPELAQLQRQIRDLQQLSVADRHLETLRAADAALKALKGRDDVRVFARILEQIRNLRSEVAHSASFGGVAEARPAYTLDDEDEHDE